jgi:organic radical activating enzyme
MQQDIRKTIELINDISPSFCAAKWYNATIWLGNGRTASCHLPPAHSIPLEEIKNNPYIEAFFKWFHASLKNNLQELRITGGEPTRSPWFWKLLDECKDTKFDFAVNSNLIMDQNKLAQLIDASKKFKKFDLYTSGEGYGAHGEFIRWGLDYSLWRKNLIQFAQEGKYSMIHVMMTISALSIWSITEFMTDMLELRKQFGGHQFHMSLNLVRFPSFQNLNVLPIDLKQIQVNKIETWLSDAVGLSSSEQNQIERIVEYLKNVDRSQEDTDSQENKQHDLKKFTQQYADRKNVDLSTVFPKEFTQWFNTI